MLRMELVGAATTMALFAVMSFAGCAVEPVGIDTSDAPETEAGVPKASSCDDRCSSSCPCHAGEGDCDSDSDCLAGLFCPPDKEGIERCQVRTGGSCDGKCSPTCRCTAGQGDCDSSQDCAAGLVCPPDGTGTERCQVASGGGDDPVDNPTTKGELKIVVFSVGSADSALIVFPTGKTMMVDSATASRAADRVVPFLQRHGIKHLNYYAETHPHPDHVGGQDLLRSKGFITSSTEVWDWKTHAYRDTFKLEGTNWFIYNARDTSFHGTDANNNSLSFRMEYNGFVYSATGDEGVRSQNRFLKDYPNLVRAHVRNTAHHLWGPVSKTFDVATDPYLFIISSIRSVKEESSWRDFMGAVNTLKSRGARYREHALTAEVGHVIVRARSGNDWNYSFCSNLNSCMVPNLR